MNAPTSVPVRDDRFFIQAIGDLGELRPVLTTRALHDAQGGMLLDRGARIDPGNVGQLIAHRPITPIEESVTTDDLISAADIRHCAEECMKQHPFFGRLAADARTRSALAEAFENLHLPQPIAFALTLAQAVRKEVFDHSIRTAITAGYLGFIDNGSRFDAAVGVAAGMLHDLGMLFIDPVVLQPQTQIDDAVRRHLYVHPLVGLALLERHFQYSKEVLAGVLEHHERLDGSGYPRGLNAKTMSHWGRLMSVAQITTAMFGGGRQHPELRLSMLLRLNRHCYDAKLVAEIQRMLEPDLQDEAATFEKMAGPVDRLKELGKRVKEWPDVAQKAVLGRQVPSEQVAHLAGLTHQVAAVARMMAEAGVAPEQLEWLDEPDNELAQAELTMLAQEMSWQLTLAANQLQRLWKVPSVGDYPSGIAQWLAQVQPAARRDEPASAEPLMPSAREPQAMAA